MNEQERNEVRRIKAQYEDHEVTKIEELKSLDRKVKLPGRLFGYIFGGCSVLIAGAGMSMGFGKLFADQSWAFPAGIAIGLVGIVFCAINPLIVKKINAAQKKKYQKEILRISDELLKENTESN